MTLRRGIVGAIVVLVLGTAMLAKPVADRVKEAALTEALAPPVAKKPKVTPLGAPTLERSETAVLILNGNGRNGARRVRNTSRRADRGRTSWR